jgi:hypothetical protein
MIEASAAVLALISLAIFAAHALDAYRNRLTPPNHRSALRRARASPFLCQLQLLFQFLHQP